MHRTATPVESELLQQHYTEQPHYGVNGVAPPRGYPGTSSPGEWFHPQQGQFSRFSNNVGALTPQEKQWMRTNPQQFWRWYYNSTPLGVIRAFEGPSPLSQRHDHVMRYINALYQNQIGSHVSAGNPLSGLISKDQNGRLVIGNRGFFDITAIPQGYLNPGIVLSPQDIEAARQKYKERLWYNSEIQSLLKNGYTWQNGISQIIEQLTDQFFQTLDVLRQQKIEIEVVPMSQQAGMERYEIQLKWDGQARAIDYLTLSDWDDFAGSVFTADKVAALTKFYSENIQRSNIGVNCAAGLGRTGVIAMAFELLHRHHEFYDRNGEPNIYLIDERLKQMRTGRPGIIQTSEQYTLAIALAHQMYVSMQLKRPLNNNEVTSIHQGMQKTIVDYQVYRQQLARQHQQSEHSTTAMIIRQIPVQHHPQPATSFDILKKAKLRQDEVGQYARELHVVVKRDPTLATDLLSKLSKSDRKMVLTELAKFDDKFVQDFKARGTSKNLFDSVTTSRKKLNDDVDDMATSISQSRYVRR